MGNENDIPIVPTCGAVIFNEDGCVLLVEHLEGASHFTGTFGLPAGRIEDGESALEGTVREVAEETGLIIEKGKLKKLPTTYQAVIERKDGRKHMSLDVFTTNIENGELRSSSETKPQWVSVVKLTTLNLLPNVYLAIQEAKSLTEAVI